jgi:hypothetical protein
VVIPVSAAEAGSRHTSESETSVLGKVDWTISADIKAATSLCDSESVVDGPAHAARYLSRIFVNRKRRPTFEVVWDQ